MLDLFAGIQMARRATEERVAYDAEMPRSARRRARWSPIRPMSFLRRSLHLGRERRATSAVGRVDSC
jgi:hypothetical protein